MLTREALEALSKAELVELCLAMQAAIQRLEAVVGEQRATIQQLETRVSELEQGLKRNSRAIVITLDAGRISGIAAPQAGRLQSVQRYDGRRTAATATSRRLATGSGDHRG